MIEVYFATNRTDGGTDDNPDFGDRFNANGPQVFRVGSGLVDRKGADDYRFKSAQKEPENMDPTAGEGVVRGSAGLFDRLRQELTESKRDILLYLHGFANSFENSLERAAQLHHEYQITPPPAPDGTRGSVYRPAVFAFSWPSNGEVFPRAEYRSDRDDAEASGLAMARSLTRLLEFLQQLLKEESRARLQAFRAGGAAVEKILCGQRIHLVAHSMGNWALRHAVLAFARDVGRRPLPRIFDHVFLMAADEDDDCFESENKLALLAELGRQIHVYHSKQDRALQISDVTKSNPNRLGADGPKNMDRINDRIVAVDCNEVDWTEVGHARHQYYRLRPEIIRDVRQVLSDVPLDVIVGRKPLNKTRSYRIQAKK